MSKAADVYSFAMMMHELLTGQQLFQGMRQSQVPFLSTCMHVPAHSMQLSRMLAMLINMSSTGCGCFIANAPAPVSAIVSSHCDSIWTSKWSMLSRPRIADQGVLFGADHLQGHHRMETHSASRH
jgi:hypothetical protein